MVVHIVFLIMIRRRKGLKVLLTFHALMTLAAAILLIGSPKTIPDMIGIHLPSEAYILSYLLGAAELSIAYLSFYARRIKDRRALKSILIMFIFVHLVTAILEGYVVYQGASVVIAGNIMLRVLVCILFIYYGAFTRKQPI